MQTLPPLPIHAWLRVAAIESLLVGTRATSILEIGVGQGAVGALLARRFDYTGLDLDETSLSKARQLFRTLDLDPIRLIHGGPERIAGRTFDLVCAFEVVEHLHDDRSALRAWRDAITDGGAIMVSMPAGPHRFGPADDRAGHFRRYSRADAERLLLEAGFGDVRIANYGFPAGYVLEAVRNVIARRAGQRQLSYEDRTLKSGRWMQPPQRAARLTRAVSKPLEIMQKPFMGWDSGTGLVALARRL